MNTEIIISSQEGNITIKQRQQILNFVDIKVSDEIKIKAQDIVNYVNSIKTPDDKMNMALDFIKSNATPAQKLGLIDIYPSWITLENYVLGEELQYKGILYSIIQTHTSQADWTPDITPALFKVIQPEGVNPDWVQPTGAHDAYDLGEKIVFFGKTYESLISSNTYSPTAYPAGWKLIV
ncbi:MAG: carbohydrate-binding protein [Clostridiaceae bacterium]